MPSLRRWRTRAQSVSRDYQSSCSISRYPVLTVRGKITTFGVWRKRRSTGPFCARTAGRPLDGAVRRVPGGDFADGDLAAFTARALTRWPAARAHQAARAALRARMSMLPARPRGWTNSGDYTARPHAGGSALSSRSNGRVAQRTILWRRTRLWVTLPALSRARPARMLWRSCSDTILRVVGDAVQHFVEYQPASPSVPARLCGAAAQKTLEQRLVVEPESITLKREHPLRHLLAALLEFGLGEHATARLPQQRNGEVVALDGLQWWAARAMTAAPLPASQVAPRAIHRPRRPARRSAAALRAAWQPPVPLRIHPTGGRVRMRCRDRCARPAAEGRRCCASRS